MLHEQSALLRRVVFQLCLEKPKGFCREPQVEHGMERKEQLQNGELGWNLSKWGFSYIFPLTRGVLL